MNSHTALASGLARHSGFRSLLAFANARESFGIEIGAIYWSGWLLPPRIVEPSSVNAIKSEFIDQL